MRPTVTAVRFAWLRRAQSWSGTVTGVMESVGVERGDHAGGGIAHGRRTEEHEPPVGGLVLLDGNRFEIVEQCVEQRLEPGGRRAWREAQVQRRVVSQRCL